MLCLFCWISRYPANQMIRVINQATESQGRTENLIRANQVYCQLCRMNYESIRPNIGSTSETCVSQVLGSYIGLSCQAHFNKILNQEFVGPLCSPRKRHRHRQRLPHVPPIMISPDV